MARSLMMKTSNYKKIFKNVAIDIGHVASLQTFQIYSNLTVFLH